MLKKKNKDKVKTKLPFWKKFLILFIVLLVLGGAGFVFLFYGPINSFKEFWITSAMTTMSHQYLATWIYSDEYIQSVLSNNEIFEIKEISNPDDIKFRKYTTTIYRNKYEKEILTRDEGNDLYKLINVSGKGYQGFLVAIYDPSRISIDRKSVV